MVKPGSTRVKPGSAQDGKGQARVKPGSGQGQARVRPGSGQGHCSWTDLVKKMIENARLRALFAMYQNHVQNCFWADLAKDMLERLMHVKGDVW